MKWMDKRIKVCKYNPIPPKYNVFLYLEFDDDDNADDEQEDSTGM